MAELNIVDQELSDKITQLKYDTVFYGTVSHIEKIEKIFKIKLDIFNQTTNDIDDQLLFNGKVRSITYSFELLIETPILTILGHKDELFEIKREKKMDSRYNTYEGILSFTTNRLYDKVNRLKQKKMYFKISKASSNEKNLYRERLNECLKHIEREWNIKEKLEIDQFNTRFSKSIGILYSQYHVGFTNCTYINMGGMTKGFFNLGYTKYSTSNLSQYTGFSRHKPDWVIISNLNINYYSAAIRFGSESIFSCDWIFPYVTQFNVNLIRLFYCILNSGGRLYMLKYKANSSVCSIKKDEVKLEVYYTSKYDMNDNGLCLYIENQDKFISFGNSDYNFMTKSLVSQHFDVLVTSHQGAKMKTKANLSNEDPLLGNRNFRIHRTDLLGTFICKL